MSGVIPIETFDMQQDSKDLTSSSIVDMYAQSERIEHSNILTNTTIWTKSVEIRNSRDFKVLVVNYLRLP